LILSIGWSLARATTKTAKEGELTKNPSGRMSIGLLIPGKGRYYGVGVGVGRMGAGATSRECGGRPGMRKLMTPGRPAGFAFALASIAGAAPGIAQDASKFVLFAFAREAPALHSQKCPRSCQTSRTRRCRRRLKARPPLAGTITAYTQARQALLKPLRDYRDSLEERAHLLQRCAR
jgi:hypothetical protein